MIEINLLPEEFRIKSAKTAQAKKRFKDTKKFLLLVPAVVAFLLFLNIYFAAICIFKNLQLAVLNNQWAKLEPERKRIESLQKEFASSSSEDQFIQQLLAQRLNLAQKLKALSSDLPSGIWFNELTFTEKGFNLKGSVISLTKEEMSLLNKFINNLKADKEFYKDFDIPDLGSLNRRSINTYEVIDFNLSANLKINE